MAASVKEVNDLTETLLEKALPAARLELDELKAFAKEQGFQGELALWDAPYWGERLREAKYEYVFCSTIGLPFFSCL
jgi:Zn-dependent oligopeptidase